MPPILPATPAEPPAPPLSSAPSRRPSSTPSGAPSRKFLLAWIAPTLLLAALWIAPLATGGRTLFLRDTLKTHLALRAYFAEALRHGELPLIDPLRAGGQGLLGNPNVVALYPDNLLLLFGSTLWQLNAHFWLHWLVALGAAAWLGREWGLSRAGAWVAGTAFAFSGFFVSQLNLYNAVAPVALAPALAAALVAAARPGSRRWALPAVGALWALELVGGDPILALLALVAALALALPFRAALPWLRVALALGAGTLLAAPQWLTTASLLPASFRGFWAGASGAVSKSSPGPAALLDLLLPFFFGRPDLNRVWGVGYFGGVPPLYFSLAPGLLALALALAGAIGHRRGPEHGRARERGHGLLVALGASGLLLSFAGGATERLLATLPGGALFRYPVKFFLFAALAGALLAGRGFERAFAGEPERRRLARIVLGLGALVACVAAILLLPPLEAPFLRLFARSLPAEALALQRLDWLRVAAVQIAVAVAGWLLVRRAAERPFEAGALWVATQVASQLLLLQPMIPTDDAAYYERRPALLDALPADAVLAHGASNDLFGPRLIDAGISLVAAERLGHEQLLSQSGLLAGRRLELDYSPEGLDSFLVQSIAQGLRFLPDVERIRVLAATGVDRLLLPRPLDPAAAALAPLERAPDAASRCAVYRIVDPIGEAQLVGGVVYAAHVGAAFDALRGAGFVPRTTAVVAGEGPPRTRPPGTVTRFESAAESVALEAESAEGGVLVVLRAWLPIWRASIDGQPAPAIVANATRLAVELPPGRHEVRLWVDRAPLRRAAALAALGALLLLLLAASGTRARA